MHYAKTLEHWLEQQDLNRTSKTETCKKAHCQIAFFLFHMHRRHYLIIVDRLDYPKSESQLERGPSPANPVSCSITDPAGQLLRGALGNLVPGDLRSCLGREDQPRSGLVQPAHDSHRIVPEHELKRVHGRANIANCSADDFILMIAHIRGHPALAAVNIHGYAFLYVELPVAHASLMQGPTVHLRVRLLPRPVKSRLPISPGVWRHRSADRAYHLGDRSS